MLMYMMNQYLDDINKNTTQRIESSLETLLNALKTNTKDLTGVRFKLKEGIMNKTLEELIDSIDILDIQTFLILNHTFINKKDIYKEVKILHKKKLYKFMLSTKLQTEFFCCKTKRKDELVKFSYKFIRKQIYKDFCRQNQDLVGMKKNEIKAVFNKKYFGNDLTAINFYKSFDLSREGLRVVKQFNPIKKLIIKFVKTNFISTLIEDYILYKPDDILKDEVSLELFVSELLSRQHKHSMTIQLVLSSLFQFIIFFKG